MWALLGVVFLWLFFLVTQPVATIGLTLAGILSAFCPIPFWTCFILAVVWLGVKKHRAKEAADAELAG